MYDVFVPFMTRYRSNEEWKISFEEPEVPMLVRYRQLASAEFFTLLSHPTKIKSHFPYF